MKKVWMSVWAWVVWFGVVLVVTGGVWGAGPQAGPLEVLFVGNSYTSRNDLPKVIVELAKVGGQRALEAGRETPGGYTLEKHVKEGKVVDRIVGNKWDYVVLQEQSQRPFVKPELMLEYGKQLDAAVKKTGGKTLLYLTWARQDMPEKQEAITKAYRELGKETGATIVPAGVAWEAVLKAEPGAGLYNADKSHPSKKGTYLTACVFYGVLYGKSPVGLPGAVAGLDDAEAAKLQRAAWEAVEEFRGGK